MVTQARADDLLDALGDGTRRAIVDLLRKGPLAVGEIAGRLPVSRPAVSKHLRVMKEAGLVVDHPEGTRRLYALDDRALVKLQAYVESFWDEPLRRFKARAEEKGTDR